MKSVFLQCANDEVMCNYNDPNSNSKYLPLLLFINRQTEREISLRLNKLFELGKLEMFRKFLALSLRNCRFSIGVRF